MDTFNAKFVEERREIGVGQLNFLAVHRGCPAMRRMLGPSGGGMTQSEKRFGNVTRHRDVDVAGGIIPINFEAEIAGTGPVFGESIFGCKGIEKVISIGLGKEFDTEIVDSKSKRRAPISVAPETRGLDDGEGRGQQQENERLGKRRDDRHRPSCEFGKPRLCRVA